MSAVDGRVVRRQLEGVERLGVRVVLWGRPEYPAQLSQIPDPPAILFVLGRLEVLNGPAVAVIGTRRPTLHGQTLAGRIAGDLARSGFTVVSGLARGIDTAAHRAVLEAGGATVAVLGTGLDVVYPPENRDLMQKIEEAGAIVTEFPLGTEPRPPHFPRRNRIISGLCEGVVVVEAGERSGALITAGYALEQGREVFAVPGNPLQPASRGTNRLLKEGARMVESVADILEELRGVGMALPTSPHVPQVIEGPAKALYGHLSDQPVHVDELAARSGLELPRILALLLDLEMRELVRQLPGKRFIRTS